MAKKKNTELKIVDRADRVPVEVLDNILNGAGSDVYTINWNNAEVTVRRTLPLADMIAFVRDVSNSCFADDTGEYLPEIKDFAIRANVLEMYANFTMPENLDNRYAVVMNTDAVDAVLAYVNPTQYHEILDAIDKRIETRASANVEMVHQKLDDLVNNFNNIYETFSGMFDNISAEDMQGLFEALRNTNFSEEAIVKAFIDNQKVDAT